MSLIRDGLSLQLVAVDNAGNVIPLAGDANGNLLLGNPGGQIGQVLLGGPGTSALAVVSSTQDGYGTTNVLFTESVISLFDGTNHQRARMASASNLNAQSGLGAAIVTPPGMWTVQNAPAAATQATATQAAGAAGVRHLGGGWTFSLVETAAPGAATQVDYVLRDGASGGGTIKDIASFSLPNVAGGSASPVPKTGLNVPGTAATAMTVEGTAAGSAATIERVAGSGYDAS